jgi:hypothetical protein
MLSVSHVMCTLEPRRTKEIILTNHDFHEFCSLFEGVASLIEFHSQVVRTQRTTTLYGNSVQPLGLHRNANNATFFKSSFQPYVYDWFMYCM